MGRLKTESPLLQWGYVHLMALQQTSPVISSYHRVFRRYGFARRSYLKSGTGVLSGSLRQRCASNLGHTLEHGPYCCRCFRKHLLR